MTDAVALTNDVWHRAFLIRAFEQRLLKLFSEGKLFGTVHTCIGQEFTGLAVAAHLADGDLIFSNHRCHGHYLARTGDVEGLMAEVMGRAAGICGGRGGSQHICAHGVFSNGIQGGTVPIAAGLALALRLRRTGGIAVVFIGDGTLGEGALYETLNIASKWSLPLLVVLENNRYAQSTSQAETLAGEIGLRPQAFGIDYFEGDTWHPERLTEIAGAAVRRVRGAGVPAFLKIDTYRLMAHSKGDDNRAASEVNHHWEIDPMAGFAREFPEKAERFLQEAEEAVTGAVEGALESPFASVDIGYEETARPICWNKTAIEGKERVVSRIYQALRDAMASDERVFLLGEDIEGPYGGAFKVTKDLSQLHPGRVRNTPISEGAITGISNGLALAGMRPVCEIMFGDFLTLAADQLINHASKFRWMYNDQTSIPVVIRTPMGGRRGYGATHSQSLEKHFLGLPGTIVLATHARYDPYLLYRELFDSVDCPVLVIENKTQYGEFVTHCTAEGFWCEHSDEAFPTTRIRAAGKPDVTIVCYGGMLTEAEKALDALFDRHEILAEVICPAQIYPLRLAAIVDSARVSGRVVVVEEGQGFCGFGSEVAASLCETLADPPKIRRLYAAPNPIPCCKPAEAMCLPDAEAIVNACVEICRQ